MSFPYDPDDLAALNRLANFYNGDNYDAVTNPGGLARGGHRVNFENALADAARVGAANAAAATAAGESAARLSGTSATSVTIGNGAKAFTTQAGKLFPPGTFLLICSAANPTVNYMAGQVASYSGTSLTVTISATGGAGEFSDWVIAVAGSPGAPGDPGGPGPQGIRGLTGAGGATSELLATAGITEQPSLVVDFIRDEFFAAGTTMSTALQPFIAALSGSSVTRPSPATCFGPDGLLKTAANNVPRIDYDPVTRQRRGMLMEQARTNLQTHSNNFSDSSWTKSGATITSNAAVGIDGLMSAAKLVESNTTAIHALIKSVTTVAGPHTQTFVLKAAGRNARIQLDDGTTTFVAGSFDLNNGTAAVSSGSGSARIFPLGNGKYKISLTGTAPSSTVRCVLYLEGGAGLSYAGDGVSGVFIEHAQLEAASEASSIITTGASAVTRAADALTIGGGSWIGSGASIGHSVLLEAISAQNFATTTFAATLSNGSTNFVGIRQGAAAPGWDLYSAVSGSGIINSGGYPTVVGEVARLAYAVDASGWAFGKDNVLSQTGGATTYPAGVDRLAVGSANFMGHIRRILFFPQRLTNAKVQAVSGIDWPAVSAHPATVRIGTVTTGAPLSAAVVTNVGTDTAAILEFVIPAGNQGPPGSLADGNKGAVTVGSGGTVWSLNDNAVETPDMVDGAVTNAKLADMATARIKGRASAGTGDPEDLTAANVRAITGQKWVLVDQQTVVGASVSGVVLTLSPSLSHYRIRAIIAPDAVAADTPSGYRISRDNGLTYDSGASDYYSTGISQSGNSIGGLATTGSSYGVFGVQADNAAQIYAGHVDAHFFKGDSVRGPHMTSISASYNAIDFATLIANSYRPLAQAATNILIFPISGGAAFAAGTTFILEGC